MADLQFRIKSDSPVVDDLMFWTVVGHEGLSRPAVYELTVLSKNGGIDGKDILGRAFDVVVEFPDADGAKHERHCQGHAVRFMRSGQVGRFHEYRITLRSWLWLLTKRVNSRILQEKKVLEVLDAVFEDSPIKRFKKLKSDGVIGTHNPRRYCVQHMESDYQFISRLLEEEGIYYWFDAHDAPGTMYLADAADVAHDKLPVTDTLRYMEYGASDARFNEISRWVSARQFDTGKYDTRDSDFKAIGKKLGSKRDTSDDHELADFEAFEFPGGYFSTDDADNTAKVRGEELIARRDRHWAITRWPDVAAGKTFKFERAPDGTSNGDYLIASCYFVITHPGYEGLAENAGNVQRLGRVLRELMTDDAINEDTSAIVRDLATATPDLALPRRGQSIFLVTALPADMPYRPPRTTPRVTMPGPQSAIVVGPKGDELHVDKHGRVKVQFHWDRYGESNEKSTCWVRVSQPMAGNTWGGYFMPRIGQEVIVDFLNGDPDRPIIVGRVYNDKQPVPYDSPTQSGFKTRSTPGGNSNNFNEIMFEDKIGEELINVHAERNMSRSVEVDDSTSVGHDQSITVENDRTVHTIGFEKREVDKDQRNIVHKNQHTNVTLNQYNHIGQYQENVVGIKGQFNQISGKVDMNIGQTLTTKVTGAMTQVSASLAITSGAIGITAASVAVGAKGDISITAQGGRKDISTGAHMIASNAGIKVVAAGDIDLMSYASINATSMGSNTTVMGANSSGYIGSSSEANMGMARSTFMGLQMDNFLGVSIANALAIQMENCAALQMHNVAALDLTNTPADIECTAVKIIQPGAGAGGAGGAAVVGALAGLAAGVLGLADSAATMKQYADAAKALRETAAELGALPELQSKLNSLADSADRRQRQLGTAVGAGVGAVVGGVIAGPAGAAAGAAVGSQLGGNYLPGAASGAAGAIDEGTKGAGAAADKAWDSVMPSPPATPGKAGGPTGGKNGGGNPAGG
ncbi:type VI secretion system Vgr family protein [Variovorax fucosicus]|uniref:type VI secretion system Vgr family protein n=1 Tax=Variovorax fucosicus TaxID=3053517 RepID=UPI002576CC88|nr:type VI secretion system tip protein TssI/VgrG [Variovorax sp. J22G47]MDM0054670.1 type VI secretion system tip protein TssI/VgrG [Variovorax sp. J22G47]